MLNMLKKCVFKAILKLTMESMFLILDVSEDCSIKLRQFERSCIHHMTWSSLVDVMIVYKQEVNKITMKVLFTFCLQNRPSN